MDKLYISILFYFILENSVSHKKEREEHLEEVNGAPTNTGGGGLKDSEERDQEPQKQRHTQLPAPASSSNSPSPPEQGQTPPLEEDVIGQKPNNLQQAPGNADGPNPQHPSGGEGGVQSSGSLADKEDEPRSTGDDDGSRSKLRGETEKKHDECLESSGCPDEDKQKKEPQPEVEEPEDGEC